MPSRTPEQIWAKENDHKTRLQYAAPDLVLALQACMRKLVELTPRDKVTSRQVAEVLMKASEALTKAGM